jgi:hypothetical protein
MTAVPDASWLYSLAAAILVFPPLLLAGSLHLVRQRHLVAVLQVHGWPRAAARAGSVVVAVSETVIGAAGVAALVLGASWRVPAVAATLLYLGYALYTGRLVRAGADVPCGCGTRDHPVTGWVAIRAALYAAASLVAVAAGGTATALDGPTAALVWASGVVIGVLLWLLPRTLAIPDGTQIGE